MPDVKTDVKFRDDDMNYWDMIDRQVPQREANYQTLGGTSDRACANCQWFVAPMGCIVVENWPDAIMPTGLSDEWRAKVTIETMMSPVPVFLVENVGEASLSMKRERGEDYRPEDYAIIPDVSKPSDWKLRLTSRPGELSAKAIEESIQWLRESPRVGEKQATGRIKGAIRRLDVDRSEKTRLMNLISERKDIQVVIHGSGDKPMTAKLFDSIKEVVSKVTRPKSTEPPILDFKSAADTGTAFKVLKDCNGDWRWLALVSNKFRDRDNPPEIFEDSAHKDFIQHLDGGGQFPQLWLWHTPGTKFGKADWADYQDGFLIMSGTIDGDKAGVAEFLASQQDLGVSHGYSYLHSDKANGIIGWYRTHEVTVLPHDAAANPWASIEFLKKEYSEMLEASKRGFLVSALGEDVVKSIEAGTQDLAKVLTDLGVESKTLDGQPATPQDGQPKLDANGQPVIEPTGTDAKAIAEALAETVAFKGFTENIKAIADRVTALEAGDDEKIAAFFRAKTVAPQQGHIASQSPTSVKADGAPPDGGPTTDWFDQVVGETLDPMKVG